MTARNDNFRHDALRRGRIDVWTKTVHCYPVVDRGFDRNSEAARRAALELLALIGSGALACSNGWHVVAGDEAYRVACMLQS